MSSFIDGPADQPWEVVENQWAGRHEPIWWVQRKGHGERVAPEDAPYEWQFGVTTDAGIEEAEELARRLNEIDRLEGENRKICAVAALEWPKKPAPAEALRQMSGLIFKARRLLEEAEPHDGCECSGCVALQALVPLLLGEFEGGEDRS